MNSGRGQTFCVSSLNSSLFDDFLCLQDICHYALCLDNLFLWFNLLFVTELLTDKLCVSRPHLITGGL